MTPLESLLLELIPQRLPPAPKAIDGPTARFLAEHPEPDMTDATLADVHHLPVGRTA